jgi:hypothetical protein
VGVWRHRGEKRLGAVYALRRAAEEAPARKPGQLVASGEQGRQEQEERGEQDDSPSWAQASKRDLDEWFYRHYRRLGYSDEQIAGLIKTILEDC